MSHTNFNTQKEYDDNIRESVRDMLRRQKVGIREHLSTTLYADLDTDEMINWDDWHTASHEEADSLVGYIATVQDILRWSENDDEIDANEPELSLKVGFRQVQTKAAYYALQADYYAALYRLTVDDILAIVGLSADDCLQEVDDTVEPTIESDTTLTE